MTATLFLSCVSKEFRSYREAMTARLRLPNLLPVAQEHFGPSGAPTLLKMSDEIIGTEALIHLIGDRTGDMAPVASVEALVRQFPDLATRFASIADWPDIIAGRTLMSLTQWEAFLGLYHHKQVVTAIPEATAPRDCGTDLPANEAALQKAHLDRLKSLGLWPITFPDVKDLILELHQTKIGDIYRAYKAKAVQPRNLPFGSLQSLFKGRETDMAAITAALQAGHNAALTSQAIHGLGGIGKTRLAVEYALAHAQDYSALLFVSGETAATLRSGLAGLVTTLDLAEKTHPEDDIRIRAVLEWLTRNPTWLLIIDNVDDQPAAEATEALVGQLHGGHVLITARYKDFGPAIKTLPLGVLSPSAARALLLDMTDGKRLPAADDAARLEEILTHLDGLALALTQAGAYIAAEEISFGDYLMLWREKRREMLARFDKRLIGSNHDIGLATTWATSVAKLSPHGRRLLDRLAFLAPDPIPDFLMDVTVDSDPVDFNARAAFKELRTYELATRPETKGGPFSVHRLLQEYAKGELGEAEAKAALTGALKWVNGGYQGDPMDVRSWPILEPLEEHAAVLVWNLADAVLTPVPTSRLMDRLATFLQARARYQEAEPLFRRALAIGEATLGLEHPNVATWLNNLAELLRATNRLAEAEPLYRRALVISKTTLGPEHPAVATRLNNLANLLCDTNRHAEAEPLYRRALAISETTLGPEHPDVAKWLNNLAGLLHATNRLAEAEPLYRRALVISETTLGPEHPAVATQLNNLANLLQATNRLAEAEPLYRRALVISETTLGPEHPNVATSLNNLAGLLRDTNRLADAEPLHRRAITIDRVSYGPDHPEVATDLLNDAVLLHSSGKPAEARDGFAEALRIYVLHSMRNGYPHENFSNACDWYRVILAELGLSPDEIVAAFAELGPGVRPPGSS